MSDRPASLLTKTQRERLSNGFEGVEGAKRRRDRQRIRERVAAGLDDVEYVLAFSEEELELALQDRDEAEIVKTAAELHFLADRISATRDVDPTTVADRVEEITSSDGTEKTAVIATADKREHDRLSDRSPWQRRGDVAIALGAALLLPALVLGIVRPSLANGPVGGVPGLLGAVFLLSGSVIVLARSLKHDVTPVLRAFVSDPAKTVRSGWDRL